MFNEVEYKLVPMELPNLLMPVERKQETVIGTAKTIPFLLPLMLKLAKTKPQWRFFCTDYTARVVEGGKLDWEAHKFRICHGAEELGSVRMSTHYTVTGSHPVFAVTNRRISDKRQRGDEVVTKDMNKAFRTIVKEFYAKTTDELVQEGERKAAQMLGQLASRARFDFNHNDTHLDRYKEKFALAHWDEFAAFAKEAGADQSKLDNYHPTKEAYEHVNNLYNRRETEGRTVILRGDEYIISRGGEKDVTIMTSSELSPHMKRCIGMLKLAEPNTFVPHVGLKVKDDLMIVVAVPAAGDKTGE